VTEILRADRWVTNARMIAEAVVPLGYIEGSILDATYGEHGGFWKEWFPEQGLTTNDLNAPDVCHDFDFRSFPWRDRNFTTVVYDPPYRLNGTPALGEMDQRFGTGERMTRDEKMTMIRDGAFECYRVTASWLLVKVMDQVEGGQMRWQTLMVTNALMEHGARLVDRFDFLTTPRAQPAGWSARPVVGKRKTCPTAEEARAYAGVDGEVVDLNRRQLTARSNYSTLLIFRKS
jgi:hypothetical protein